MVELFIIALVKTVAHSGGLSVSDVATVAAATFAGLAFLGMAYYGFIRGKGKEGQSKAKDDIIETYQQSVEALEVRISTLESELKRVGTLSKDQANQISDLQTQVAVAEARYGELERYAAPEAVHHFEEMLLTQTEIIGTLNTLLTKRSIRFDQLDKELGKLTRVVEHLQQTLGPRS